MKIGIIFLCCLFSTFFQTDDAYNYSLENDLRTLLFTTNSYNRFTRPSAIVSVNMTLNILTITSLSIKDQKLSLAGYFDYEWEDSRLSWSSNALYNTDIPSFYTTQDYVWIPSLIVSNSVSDIEVISDNTVLVRVGSDGTCLWTPGGVYETQCVTDVTYYPFDSQLCDLSLSTWGYTSIELNLVASDKPVDLTYYKENGEWDYVSFTTSEETPTRGAHSFAQITFSLKFKRRPYFQIMNTIIPIILLASLSCFVFQLPIDSGEKIGYSLTVLLAFAVYLTLISDNIPTTSINTSCLSVYLIIILALGVVSVVITIFVEKFYYMDEEEPIPNSLRFFVTKIAVRFICSCKNKCLCSKRNNVAESDIEIKKIDNIEYKKTQAGEDDDLKWTDISKIFDKFFFRVYVIILSILTFTVLITFVVAYNIS